MLETLIEALSTNPLLYLFLIVALGYPLGRIKILGVSLGVAAALFVGLGFGSLSPAMRLPDIVPMLGLVLFVYCIGLSSGPSFAASLRRQGVRDNLFAAGVIAAGAGLALALGAALGLSAPMTAGMFAGALTNTPALAAALETIRHAAPPEVAEKLAGEPVVAYSIAYPMGVVGIMLAFAAAERLFRVDYAEEARRARGFSSQGEEIIVHTARVTSPEAAGKTVRDMVKGKWNVVFSRVKRGGHFLAPSADTALEPGDLVTVVGARSEVARAGAMLGEACEENIDRDNTELQMRRIFVSSHEVIGRMVKDLGLTRRFGAVITRLRRGDMDMIVNGKTVLEPGDRVRVVAPHAQMGKVSEFLGDSYRAVSEVDALTFSLGLALGLAVGMIPVPLPGMGEFRLGAAGGPLVVGLILGARGRTGGLVWTIPYGVNMTLRQFGLMLFLAGVGTKAGYGFATTLLSGGGLVVFAGGAVVTFTVAVASLVIGRVGWGISFPLLMGMVAGVHTQPAALAFAVERSKSDLVNQGYSYVFPAATVMKIILAQAMVMGMGG